MFEGLILGWCFGGVIVWVYLLVSVCCWWVVFFLGFFVFGLSLGWVWVCGVVCCFVVGVILF